MEPVKPVRRENEPDREVKREENRVRGSAAWISGRVHRTPRIGTGRERVKPWLAFDT